MKEYYFDDKMICSEARRICKEEVWRIRDFDPGTMYISTDLGLVLCNDKKLQIGAGMIALSEGKISNRNSTYLHLWYIDNGICYIRFFFKKCKTDNCLIKKAIEFVGACKKGKVKKAEWAKNNPNRT